MKTARFLVDQLRRLHEAGVKTFIIRGTTTPEVSDHPGADPSRFGQSLRGRAEAVSLACGGSLPAVHGVSFCPEARAREPVAEVPSAGSRKRQYRMLHTSVDGSSAHSPYAPCRLADLHGAVF